MKINVLWLLGAVFFFLNFCFFGWIFYARLSLEYNELGLYFDEHSSIVYKAEAIYFYGFLTLICFVLTLVFSFFAMKKIKKKGPLSIKPFFNEKQGEKMTGETNLNVLINNMNPRLNDGDYVFCALTTGQIDLSGVLFFFKEKEGLTVVLSENDAKKRRYAYQSVFSWITLEVHSSLEAVGLTAAFSQALAAQNISCNVVAGYYHDHIFVPKAQRIKALEALKSLKK